MVNLFFNDDLVTVDQNRYHLPINNTITSSRVVDITDDTDDISCWLNIYIGHYSPILS